MEFKAFPKIEKFGKVFMQITQKIHGTNAQVFIFEDRRTINMVPASATLAEVQDLYPNLKIELSPYSQDQSCVIEVFTNLICGSRTRWIYPGDDNYGFAAFVHSHREEFIAKLGLGQHFGEWAGLGINSGEGMTDKKFVLFDFWKYPPERQLPPGCVVVPVLYNGPMNLEKIEEVMQDLKTNGSKLAPGFMRPEGIVILAMGTRYKKVFDAEETAWKQGDSNAKKIKEDESQKVQLQYGHLFQPIRLEKIVSKDERYTREFPKSMPQIADAYWDDLVAEGQVTGSEGELKGIRKMIGSELFKFVRIFMEKGIDAMGGLQL